MLWKKGFALSCWTVQSSKKPYVCSALSPQPWKSPAACKALLWQQTSQMTSVDLSWNPACQSPLRLLTQQQECPRFRDAPTGVLITQGWDHLSSVLNVREETISWRLVQQNCFWSCHQICCLARRLLQYRKARKPPDELRLFFSDMHRKNFSLVFKQLWKPCGFKPLRGIFLCV